VTLFYIVAATGLGGLLSLAAAASLSRAMLARLVSHLVSLSAGVLLGTALLDILPEAFQSRVDPRSLFATLLAGLLFFFLLEKAEVLRQSRKRADLPPEARPGGTREPPGRGGWSVIMGDSIHNFCDGIIISASFLADTRLGLVTSLAIIAHEIPQEIGDFVVLLNAGFPRRAALGYNALSGAAAVLGGVIGYFVVGPWEALFPYLLVVAASSFVYVSLADLFPQMQRPMSWRAALRQLGWLAAGLVLVAIAVAQLGPR